MINRRYGPFLLLIVISVVTGSTVHPTVQLYGFLELHYVIGGWAYSYTSVIDKLFLALVDENVFFFYRFDDSTFVAFLISLCS